MREQTGGSVTKVNEVDSCSSPVPGRPHLQAGDKRSLWQSGTLRVAPPATGLPRAAGREQAGGPVTKLTSTPEALGGVL